MQRDSVVPGGQPPLPLGGGQRGQRRFPAPARHALQVWDLSIPEIAHTFNVRLSAVKKLAVPRPGGDSPVIVAGLACGSISTCDMRTGTSFNYRHSAVTGEVTALSFQPHDANRVVVGYEDSSACVWDLRRYSKPLAALGSGGDVDRRAVVQGCSVAYADAGVMSLPGSELPVSLSQDFVNEDDVWSYVMCAGTATCHVASIGVAAKQPGSTGSGAVCGKVASGIDNGDDPAGISVNNAVDPFAGMKVAKASVLPLDKPPPKGKRARSTVSVTDLLTGGTPLPSPAASSQRPKPRAAKPTSGAGTISSLFSKYKITDHRRRLYSGPDPVSTPATPSAPSGGPIPAPRPTPTRKERLPKFKSRGIPTAFECTPDGTDLFVASKLRLAQWLMGQGHKGHVEQYDGRNYRLVRHFDVDALTRPYQAGEPKGFAQRMRLLALADDSCVLFNVREQLAVLDVRRGALRSAVALQWESHEALVDAGPHQPADAAPAAQKYVTDFTALRGRRDVYALNERGELFVVHPVRVRTAVRGARDTDAMDVASHDARAAGRGEEPRHPKTDGPWDPHGRPRPTDLPEASEPLEPQDVPGKSGSTPGRRLTILMVSEFFYPDVGGIETHICALSTALIALGRRRTPGRHGAAGYRVVVVTRHFGERRGVRYMSNGTKVYHIPTLFYVKPCGLPTFVGTFPLARNIFIREQVDVVHVHQTSSRYGCEFVYAAWIMGLRTVFTDHSLFSFVELGPVTLTDHLRHMSAILDHTICVSTAHKENLMLRTQMDPTAISVIGNAIVRFLLGRRHLLQNADNFPPSTRTRADGRVVIVVVSRLTPKKGTELLNDVIPIVCKRHDNVDFIVGGDGPLYSSIVERIDKLYLHKRVTLLGTVPSYKVNEVLVQGDIFLNTSKSESFCIAILEAVSSGLLCVATDVGGVREILPRDMVLLANYYPESIADRIDDAIKMLPFVDRQRLHDRVRAMYSWRRVAEEVSLVYRNAVRRPPRSALDTICAFWDTPTIFRRLLSSSVHCLQGVICY
ncbi:phosphatidylinositol N-acetylglucosaminyltransferase subunit A, putative [Babesia caballi]|uniref:Phosphatidylinositol N-acetylglucosaminyltransferase subunit A, putative n=1 Tax=Babesia caballi TaxID=5871 RepID=A0AAV4LN33_BABCB|nr:phosphatidylinositol N-acetylglucosaminyltransferase subunit A, putative [Babesia caballi]